MRVREKLLPMAGQMAAKTGAAAVPVTIGDMTNERVPGAPFALVYLVANTIMNVTTQKDQLAVFANAAAHLEPGGFFVVEVIIPQLRRVPPGETARVFTLDPDHVVFEKLPRLLAGAALPDPGFADDLEAVLADVGPTPDDPWARS